MESDPREGAGISRQTEIAKTFSRTTKQGEVMKPFDQQWQKLITAARQAPAEAGAAAPYGFATRLAAQAATLAPAPWLRLERFALRGLLLAAVCSVAAFVLNFADVPSDRPD